MVSTLPITEQRQGNALRIDGEGGFPVESIANFLLSLEYAYNSAYVFDSILDQAHELLETGTPLPARNLLWMQWWPPTPEKVAAMVPESDRLILTSVELHSPGMWDFLGKLNPLETLRLYLNDRNERRKDVAYRDAADARRRRLEDEMIALENVARKVEILKSLGVPEKDISVMVEQLLFPPLRELSAHQDQGMLEGAEVVDLDTVKKRSPKYQ